MSTQRTEFQEGDLVYYQIGVRYTRYGNGIPVEIVSRVRAIVTRVTKTRVVIRIGSWNLDWCEAQHRNTVPAKLTLFARRDEF